MGGGGAKHRVYTWVEGQSTVGTYTWVRGEGARCRRYTWVGGGRARCRGTPGWVEGGAWHRGYTWVDEGRSNVQEVLKASLGTSVLPRLSSHDLGYSKINFALPLHFDDHTLRILYTDRQVRTTLYTIINSTIGKYCSIAFLIK